MKNRLIHLLCVWQILFLSCKKETPIIPNVISEDTQGITKLKVLIANEGNFQWNNAELSLLNLSTGNITENIYQASNETAMGDVCQSVYIHDNQLFVVLNNSNKIEVLNAQTFQKIHTIQNLISPRYFLPIQGNKAYVSDLYSNHISVVDLQNYTISKTIDCPGWTEQMISYQGYTYVTNRTRKQLYLLDENTDILIDSISIGYGANSIQKDKNNVLWVLCSGDQNLNEPAGLYTINIDNKISEKKIALPNHELAWRMSIDQKTNQLYFLQKNIYIIDLDQSSLELREIISGDQKKFYGLGIHPENQTIYVSDAIDYIQKGSVEIYSKEFLKTSSFKAGIIPGDFVFF